MRFARLLLVALTLILSFAGGSAVRNIASIRVINAPPPKRTALAKAMHVPLPPKMESAPLAL